MRNYFKKHFVLVFAIMMFLAVPLAGCGSESSSNATSTPEIDTSEYYDYVLCSGGGYLIVAKQVESVTDVTEYVGVLDESFNWVIPLSDNTPLNPNGRVASQSVHSDFSDRCNAVRIQHAGDEFFVYGERGVSTGGPVLEGIDVKIFNAKENTWKDVEYDYTSFEHMYFTDGYYVAQHRKSGTSHDYYGNYVVIISPSTGARLTNIYCDFYKYVGRYSEGVFFSYDGFYDVSENKVIDLSEYAGLITNQPYFANGQCKLVAVNENGTEFAATIDLNGNFISEFTKTEN